MKEYYHTLEEYTSVGLGPYLEHCNDFLKGKRTIPVSRSPNLQKNDQLISFTFTEDLIRRILQENEKVIKSYVTALRYGFRGISHGGKNGIFLQRRSDKQLSKKTMFFIEKKQEEVMDRLAFLMTITDSHADGPELFPTISEWLSKPTLVKIVHHDPSGNRVVGIMVKNFFVFVGVAKY